MDRVLSDLQPGLGTTAIVGELTLTKTGTTARTATFPDASITVAGLGLAQTWTADQTFDVIKTQHCDAATSAGVHIGNASHQDVAIFGAGGGQGTTFYGQINGTTQSMSGQITSTVTTGSSPFVVASTTKVANLNVDYLNGTTWAAPGAIGGTTPAAGAFTTLTASGAVSGSSLTTASSVYVSNTNGISLSDNAVGGSIGYGYNSGRTNPASHIWYNGISTQVMSLSAAGALTTSAGISCTTLTASGAASIGTHDDASSYLGLSRWSASIKFAYLSAGFANGATQNDTGLRINVLDAGGVQIRAIELASNGAATFASSVSCAGLTSTVAGVAATFDSGAASDARMEFKRNNVRQGLFSWDTSALRFEGDATASSAIYFKAGGADRLTIASGGTVTVTSTNDGSLTCAGRITAKVAVPGSFADLAAVQSYLVSILT